MTQKITRTALLLAAALLLQGLRLLVPVPPQISMFVIGALVNACFIVAVRAAGLRSGVIIACAVPVFAWLEGMLPFLPFAVPVALGNTVFVLLAYRLKHWRGSGYWGIPAAAVCKMLVLYGSFYMLFACISVPAAVRHMVLFTMSWPQLWTGITGGMLGVCISSRLPRL